MTQLMIADVSIRQDAEGRFYLNDLHRAAGGEEKHQPAFFLRMQQTQDLIEEINSANSQSLTAGIHAVKSKEGRGGGTYACKELVYAYAMWISAKFHLQVIRAYDALVIGYAEKQQEFAPRKSGNSGLDGKRKAEAVKLMTDTARSICEDLSLLSGEGKQCVYASLINPIMGNEVIPLPLLQEKYYSAGEVGLQIGISGNMVGKLANKHNLKTDQYGKSFLDKSRHSSKQVQTFRYNPRAIEKIRELLDVANDSDHEQSESLFALHGGVAAA